MSIGITALGSSVNQLFLSDRRHAHANWPEMEVWG
jgi:hypothetical protein